MAKSKDVLVIGGGIAGIQAALDLADKGLHVYMVEREPSIGGRMAQFDKTYPTNDCSICILAPKMLECYDHPNITVYTYSEVKEVNGSAGDFKVKVRKKPRYVDEDKCTGCGLCSDACRLRDRYPNDFEAGIGKRSAIYMSFLQAVPKISIVDAEHCLMITKKKCGKHPPCLEACPADAIDFEQKEEEMEAEVGAIIVATGLDTYDPSEIKEYGYGNYKNVITGLEYERIINAAGPTGGELVRPSDKIHAKKIAFILCVGCRDLRHTPYCSGVCCMYAIKNAVLAKIHDEHIEPYVFYIDLRTYGKGFDEYARRAKEEYGVNFIRSKPAKITENPETKNLFIWYENTIDRKLERKEVDMVVLANAAIPRKNSGELAEILGVELDEYGFFKVKSDLYDSTTTTKPGIFVAGFAQFPKDITDSVIQGSAAASKASAVIS